MRRWRGWWPSACSTVDFYFLYCRHLHLPAQQRREPAVSAPDADLRAEPYSKCTVQSRHTWSDFPMDTESYCSLIFFSCCEYIVYWTIDYNSPVERSFQKFCSKLLCRNFFVALCERNWCETTSVQVCCLNCNIDQADMLHWLLSSSWHCKIL